MNLSNKANEIADRLQHEATVKYSKQMAEVTAEKNGYVQACEDFARELRIYDRELIN